MTRPTLEWVGWCTVAVLFGHLILLALDPELRARLPKEERTVEFVHIDEAIEYGRMVVVKKHSGVEEEFYASL